MSRKASHADSMSGNTSTPIPAPAMARLTRSARRSWSSTSAMRFIFVSIGSAKLSACVLGMPLTNQQPSGWHAISCVRQRQEALLYIGDVIWPRHSFQGMVQPKTFRCVATGHLRCGVHSVATADLVDEI